MTAFDHYFVCIIIACGLATTAHAQYDSLLLPAQKVSDTTQQLVNNAQLQLNSITKPRFVAGVTDTVTFYRQKLDSLTQRVNQRIASLQSEYHGELNKITRVQTNLQSKLDSLAKKNLTIDDIKARLDSVQQRVNGMQQQLQSKLSDVKYQAIQSIDRIDLPPELQKGAAEIKAAVSRLSPQQILGNTSTELAGLGAITGDIPSIPTVPSVVGNLSNPIDIPGSSAISDIPIKSAQSSLGTGQIAELNLPKPKELSEVSKVTEATSKVSQPIAELKNIKDQPIDKLADDKLASVTEVSEIKKRAQIEGIGSIQSEEALKVELKQHARAAAIDHFGDKQAELKSAMEKLAVYKRKYGEITSIKDLKKAPENPLKKKSFYERLVPGVNLQILKKGDDILLDFNLYAGFRFTKYITAGGGWNQRLGYRWDQKSFHPDARVFGPRLFGEYHLSKGFSPRLELEVMNTTVPPATVKHGDPYERRWVTGAFAGIKKQYKITKQLRGTASVMFRLFDPNRQSPYGDVVNARFGFEYVIKRKHEKNKS